LARYRLAFDLHTHTVFSHGKGTIEDNVAVAREKGLKRLGISDHGPGHALYGVRRGRFAEMRAEVDRLNRLYPDIEISLGLEANIASPSGRLDLEGGELAMFDYVMAGYHFGAFGEAPLYAASLAVRNWIGGIAGRWGRKLVAANTDLVEKAIYENRIFALTHPGDKGAVDIEAVARACAARGVLFELNAAHGGLSEGDLALAARCGVRFLIGSDAHSPERVGEFGGAVGLALRAGIDLGRIVNLVEEDTGDGAEGGEGAGKWMS
jgi:putative hydrolase